MHCRYWLTLALLWTDVGLYLVRTFHVSYQIDDVFGSVAPEVSVVKLSSSSVDPSSSLVPWICFQCRRIASAAVLPQCTRYVLTCLGMSWPEHRSIGQLPNLLKVQNWSMGIVLPDERLHDLHSCELIYVYIYIYCAYKNIYSYIYNIYGLSRELSWCAPE